MQFQASSSLRSRTFIGLIIAQFLAAFNDQAIHASAMFYSIRQGTLTEKSAITLMPILFFAPWAIFCTLAGYLSDRYSKRNSLVAWKVAEVGITLVALLGFWMGTSLHNPWGPWIVLSTVFLMGTHSAYFVPAKYGAMPEILQPQLLSKGNGLLESTSFLAVILGTVTGGMLSFVFRRQEYFIGILLVVLALIGAVASMLIERIPAANPTRPFPRNLLKPLLDNLRIMLRSKPLALSVLGIAFFTFMVAFMRATMYMHGEAHNWNEFRTSLVVGTVALGVGLGSPLAGWLSGGKVELGLVPLGAVGMIAASVLAAFSIFKLAGLITALILIGFFSGFYIVPLYTLLQHRAPKASKGDLIATSNFINVTGAIAASVLFYTLVFTATLLGAVPLVAQRDDVARGELVRLQYRNGRPAYFSVLGEPGTAPFKVGRPLPRRTDNPDPDAYEPVQAAPIDADARVIAVMGEVREAAPDTPGSQVIVSTYTLRGITHYRVRAADQPLGEVHDKEELPFYLFIGAGLMTLGILLLLCRQLPDFFVRALLWLRSHGRYRLKVIGLHNLPSDGPVILATNCDRFETCMQVVTATDRLTRIILLENPADAPPRPLLRYLARRTGLIALRAGQSTQEAWDKALVRATRTLGQGNLLGLTIASEEPSAEMERLLGSTLDLTPAPILPVYCGALPTTDQDIMADRPRRVQVVIGHVLRPEAAYDEIRQAIRQLGEWMRQTDQDGLLATTMMIPGASGVAAARPAADHSAHS